jgi:very-short-patch-repair endonuclease
LTPRGPFLTDPRGYRHIPRATRARFLATLEGDRPCVRYLHGNSTTPQWQAPVSVLDTLISRLAARQHGVVAIWQLAALGIEPSAVRRRVADGRLCRVHRGVYAVGPLDRNGYRMAAVLACGEGALLSHRDAAALWNLRQSNRTAIDVTVPGARRRRRARIAVHGAGEIHPDDRAEVDGTPVTSVARTLLDLAEVVPSEHLRRAYEAAERHELLDMRAVNELIARSNGRRGLPALLALLDHDPREALESKSDLESRFLDLVREAGLPLPQLNVLVEGFLVDAYWPTARLVVELQSWEHHGHRQAFERDNSKLTHLQVAGYRALPVTDRHLRHERERIVASIRAVLSETGSELMAGEGAVAGPNL